MNYSAMVSLTWHQSIGAGATQLPQGREPGLMTDDEYQPVAVSRRIGAPAHDIFQVLANPARHPDFDGSEALRGAGSTAVISGVGDVFVMKMYYSHLGDYEMNNHVVEYEQDRRIGWETGARRGHPRVGRAVGQRGGDLPTPRGRVAA